MKIVQILLAITLSVCKKKKQIYHQYQPIYIQNQPTIEVHHPVTVTGRMTNIAPESTGIINPEIAAPKRLQTTIHHQDNIVQENQIVGNTLSHHQQHHYDQFGNYITSTLHQTQENIIQPVQKVYRTTTMQQQLIDHATGQLIVPIPGPLQNHGIERI